MSIKRKHRVNLSKKKQGAMDHMRNIQIMMYFYSYLHYTLSLIGFYIIRKNQSAIDGSET